MSLLINLLAVNFVAQAILPPVSVHEIPGIKNAKLEIRFNNPDCRDHFYEEAIETNRGDLVSQKPKGVFCQGAEDITASVNWSHSPRKKLIQWINDDDTKEIFFAYQSISDRKTLGAICEAIKDREIKVTFILSRNRNYLDEGGRDPLIDISQPFTETESTMKKYNRVMSKLTACDLPPSAPQPVGIIRGHTGRSESNALGWAHNKFFVINPSDKNKIHFASGSSNLTTSGLSTNHENWLFFEDIPQKTYLAQSLQCMIKLQKDDSAHLSLSDYVKMNRRCLDKIPNSYKKARGIQSFFVPGEGRKAISKHLVPAFSHSRKIIAATHLLGFPSLFIRGLSCAAQEKPSKSCYRKQGGVPAFKGISGDADVRLITDDDIHWLMVGQYDPEKRKVGYNDIWEARNAERARKSGVRLGFMETSHQNGRIQLHHNKMILFEDGKVDAVWTGAGNFTRNAMYSNFENYFFITIPSVVEAYSQQMHGMWYDMATSYRDMPKLDTAPALEN